MTWRWLVLGAAIVGVVLFVDPATLATGVDTIAQRPFPLLAAVVAYTAAFALRAVAWGPLLPTPVAWSRRVRAILAMLAVNHTLPGPVGEIVRAREVVSDGLPLRSALLSVVAARAVDVFAVGALLGTSALLAGEAPTWIRWAAPAAIGLPTAAGWVAHRRGVRVRGPQMAASAAWAVPSWALEAGVVMVIAAAAGHPLSLAAAVLVTCASLLAQVAAVLPGGIGTYEFGMTTALAALGVPVEEALAIAVMSHAVKFVYALAVGLPALAPWRRRRLPTPSDVPVAEAIPAATFDDASPVASRRPAVVVLPVHDEAATVVEVIDAVPPVVHGHPTRVVVVDDGSSDRSGALARAAGAEVISHGRCRGLGAAVRTGFEAALEADAWAVAFLDADGEYRPEQLADVLAPIAAGDADYVVGSRFAGTIEAMHLHRRVGNLVLTWLVSLVTRRRISDGQSGYRALSRAALAAAEIEHDYNYAQVLTLDLLRKGYRYAEVPIRYHRRTHGRSFVKLGRYLRAVLPAMWRVIRRTTQPSWVARLAAELTASAEAEPHPQAVR